MRQSRLPGTPSLLRAINDRAALELLLEHGKLTRAQIGEFTGLSKVTASQLVERLEERNLVTRVGELAGGRGPNAQLYAVVAGNAFAVGVEVGPGQVIAACADMTGGAAVPVEVGTQDSTDPVAVVKAAVLDAAASAGAPWQRVRRVVLGTPGLVDPAGELAFSPDLPQWHHGLIAALRSDLKRPVTLENEVNLAAVAEARCGAARGVDDFVLVWIGRSVGLGVVLGGELHRGAAGAAGEIGHLQVSRPPLAAAPHGDGLSEATSFQATVNADMVLTLARANGLPATSAAGALRAAIDAGAGGEALLDELAHRIGLGVVAACVVLDPGLVVLAGEVGRAGGEALASRVRDHVERLSPARPRVLASQLSSDAILRGALLTGVAATREDVFASMLD